MAENNKSRKSTNPENPMKTSQRKKAKKGRKSRGSFKSEKVGKKSQKRKKERNLGFENIQISYGNHLMKDAKQRANLKAKRSRNKKAKTKSHLKKTISPKGRRSAQSKLKGARPNKSTKNSIKSNPKFKSE